MTVQPTEVSSAHRAVFVTGGAGALGSAVARALAGRGLAVALVDLEQSAVDAIAELIGEGNSRVVAVGADLTDAEQVELSWQTASEELGTPDVLVNVAGTFEPNPLASISRQDWEKAIALHMTAPFLLTQLASADWISAGSKGSIVNVSSTAAFQAHEAGSASYGASKAGLAGLTVHCAVELGPHGIRTNCVLPGSFPSQINANRLAEPGALAAAEQHVPLRRLGSAEEMARLIEFLALDATYLNGTLIRCDGGTAVKMF